MTSRVSAFKIWNRGFKENMVLVPGWATDSRIFSALDLHANYLLPTSIQPFHFKEDLRAFLDAQSIDKVSLFGWSSGGFLATDFALENSSRIEELILVSIRRSYPVLALKKIRGYLEKNRRAYLYKFYLECF